MGSQLRTICSIALRPLNPEGFPKTARSVIIRPAKSQAPQVKERYRSHSWTMTDLLATPDFLVIGGGILGVSIARELTRRHPDQSVQLIEKESTLGEHASGRNSGVLHAGFYYSPESLKAKFTREGNHELSNYCLEHNLPILRCGKLVVAKNAKQVSDLKSLFDRGLKNGVDLQWIDEVQAKAIEPRVKTFENAIYSPHTASVDPLWVLKSLSNDAIERGLRIQSNTQFLGVDQSATIRTSKGAIRPGYTINAAGLYADKVARAFGFARNHRILPFKGLYLYSSEPAYSLRTNIYPVPDPDFPFLGVHFTVTVTGRIKIGPTAMPALWREQYQGLNNFSLRECFDVGCRTAKMLCGSDALFRRHALNEIRKSSRRQLVHLASELAKDVHVSDFLKWGTPGIRAQLLDIRKRKLETDFVIEGDARSTHVLNAVSPGFTCALPFSRHVIDFVNKMVASAPSHHSDPNGPTGRSLNELSRRADPSRAS